MEIDSMTLFFPWIGLLILAFYLVYARLNQAGEQLSIGVAMMFQEFLSTFLEEIEPDDDEDKNETEEPPMEYYNLIYPFNFDVTS